MKIQEIKDQFNSCSPEDLPRLMEAYSADERSGVQAEIARAKKRLEALEKEKERPRRCSSMKENMKAPALSAVSTKWEEARWQARLWQAP